ncbi:MULTISPECIES: hypothetical protein [Nostoc]|uniref:N-acetyltransferase domain-containing protein n=1 Tax=Nostoc paludosum FACHB-159 TaxID=2692908 RepID=A0ABR8K9A5_9NOSO|nr:MULTISPECIES: hypothetical protein [Nostoc]MBD2679118.1 hypothetical protein [Nostoc sp. FACHB-857]MBD2735498.1 hypothetical protein [Nostoc paludosum FACHB-159]
MINKLDGMTNNLDGKVDIPHEHRNITDYDVPQDYVIKLVEHDFIKTKWVEIEILMKKAFRYSKFNEEYKQEELPLEYTWSSVNNPSRQGLKHLVAMNMEGKILGVIFGVPTYRYEDEISCEIGWFFTSDELIPKARIKIADELFKRVHEEVRNAGFKEVVTDIGTQAGAKYLSRKHGYLHRPLENNTNRWVRYL